MENTQQKNLRFNQIYRKSIPKAIFHRYFPRPRSMAAPRCRAPWSCPVVRSRCGRARCPHRAAAPRRGARLCIPRYSRAPWCGPVAVGRDVPIAPPRLGAVRGLASRAPSPVPRCHAPFPCPVAVGRDDWPPGLPARAVNPRPAAA